MSKKVENSNNAYKQDKLGKIPSWIKIILLKYWVAGATFYFFGMGGYAIWNNGSGRSALTIRLLATIGFGYTLAKEYIEKHIIRLMRTSTDDTYKYNLINLHGSKSFFLHLIYCYFATYIMMVVVVNCFNYDKIWGIKTSGAEPLGVAVIYLSIDIIAIAIKDLIILGIKRVKYKKNLKLQQSLLDEDDVKLYGEEENSESNNIDNFTNDENKDDDSNNNVKEN